MEEQVVRKREKMDGLLLLLLLLVVEGCGCDWFGVVELAGVEDADGDREEGL